MSHRGDAPYFPRSINSKEQLGEKDSVFDLDSGPAYKLRDNNTKKERLASPLP